MQDTPFDHLAKTAWENLLSPFRDCEVQRQIQLSGMYADFWTWNGTPLPDWMGIFADIVSTALVVGETETGHLTWYELRRALLKLRMGEELALSLLKARGTNAGPYPLEVRGLVIAEHVAEAMLVERLSADKLKRPERGLWVYEDRLPMYIVSVHDLAYRNETAVLHVLGRSPRLADAMGYLFEREEPEARNLATVLYKEVEDMLREGSKEGVHRMSREEAAVILQQLHERFVARGRREGLQEGLQRGRLEGRQEGRIETLRHGIYRLWRRKFGVVPDWVRMRVSETADPEPLERLMEEIGVAASAEALERLVQETLPAPSR